MFKFEDPELLETWFHESACHAGRRAQRLAFSKNLTNEPGFPGTLYAYTSLVGLGSKTSLNRYRILFARRCTRQ
jgi:hypothetical protein